jgi:hypothetical protein
MVLHRSESNPIVKQHTKSNNQHISTRLRALLVLHDRGILGPGGNDSASLGTIPICIVYSSLDNYIISINQSSSYRSYALSYQHLLLLPLPYTSSCKSLTIVPMP